MKTVFLFVFGCVSCFVCQAETFSQQPEIFAGHGFRNFDQPDQETKSKLHWPLLKDFSTEKDKDSGRFQLFGQSSTPEYSHQEQVDREGSSKRFGNFPPLFSKREPGEPGFIQQMNAKSKAMVDRTTDWAQEKNQNFRQRTANTWDSITKDLRPGQMRGGADSNPRSPFGIAPPMRAAENMDQEKPARF